MSISENITRFEHLKKANKVARLLSAANTTNATSVKTTSGDVFKVIGYNAGTVSYLKFYNLATSPTVGTSTPLFTFYLPANTAFALDLDGYFFSVGIAYALTTAGADNDTGAVAAGAVLGLNIAYQ